MTTEVKCWCKHCNEELTPNHVGPCPKCGKTGKNCSVSASATVGIEASVSATHKQKASGASLTILFGLAAIIVALLLSLLLPLLPFSLLYNGLIVFGITIFLGIVFWWQRYHVTIFLRWVEDRIGGQKTFKGK